MKKNIQTLFLSEDRANANRPRKEVKASVTEDWFKAHGAEKWIQFLKEGNKPQSTAFAAYIGTTRESFNNWTFPSWREWAKKVEAEYAAGVAQQISDAAFDADTYRNEVFFKTVSRRDHKGNQLSVERWTLIMKEANIGKLIDVCIFAQKNPFDLKPSDTIDYIRDVLRKDIDQRESYEWRIALRS